MEQDDDRLLQPLHLQHLQPAQVDGGGGGGGAGLGAGPPAGGHLPQGRLPRVPPAGGVSLGGEREEGFTFKVPGADHHARWMSKGIYYLKMFLLSHQFRLSEEEWEQVRRIVIFVIIMRGPGSRRPCPAPPPGTT